MTTKLDRSRRTGGALAGVALAIASSAWIATGGLAARAQDKPAATGDPGVWITEVDKDADTGQVQILLNVGRDMGLERGDVLEIEREGKTIARASIVASYADVSVAQVSEVLEKGVAIARGDWVRPKNGTKRPPRVVSQITNTVTEVKDGRATVNGGRSMGLRQGDEATVIRDGKPVARVKLEIVNDTMSGGPILEGDVKVGDKVEFTPAEHAHGALGHDKLQPELSPEELKRMEREAESPKGLDFVATHFLGVVGELEHPVPIAAPCHIGVLVRRVIAGSPADKAKIRAGDRVIAIDDRVVRSISEVYRGVQRRSGDFVRVTIARDDTLQTVSADFRKRY
jgi:hypothetical protein